MLQPIIDSTGQRVAALRRRADELTAAAAVAPPPRGFKAALAEPGLQVIAEIKRRSPSAGLLRTDLDPAARSVAYEAGGAAVISVLTEPDFFGGSSEDLATVRAAVALPVLRKDFILDPVQVWESRAIGADAVLLIVAILEDDVLRACLDTARLVGLDVLVEAHTSTEAERALATGADIVGINNRDLSTFVTDLAVAERVAAALSDARERSDIVTVAESGVSSRRAAERMAAAGYDAILVGEALVRAEDPASLLAALRGAA